jgi:hypothetical protein
MRPARLWLSRVDSQRSTADRRPLAVDVHTQRKHRETLYEPLTLRRLLGYIAGAALVFALLYVGYLAVAAHRTGYSWAEMDWNSSGHTSPFEYLRANSVGHRGIERAGRACTEYYEIRSRRPLRVDC